MYNQVLSFLPDHPDANHLLGVLLQHTGSAEKAITLIKKALTVKPGEPIFLCNLGEAFRASGNNAEAIAQHRQALAIKPNFAEAHNNLGLAYLQTGQLEDARRSFQSAGQIQPTFADAWCNLGLVHIRQKAYAEAVLALRKSIQHQPNYAQAYYYLGLAFYEQNLLNNAIGALEQAISIQPDYAEAHNTLGNALFSRGNLEGAMRAFEHAILQQPDLAEAYVNLGDVLNHMGRLHDSETVIREALRQRDTFAAAHESLGNILQCQGKSTEAAIHFEKALLLDADNFDALSGLGLALGDQGKIIEATDILHKAVTLCLKQATLNKYLYMLNFHPGMTAEAVSGEHRRWCDQLAMAPDNSYTFPAGRRKLAKILRIGYVSPDFRRHSVAYFFEPLLRCHHAAKVEVFCYANVKTPDAVTERLKGLSHHWRDIAWLSDTEAAQQIHKDGIDILVDLAGHTGGNRLPIFPHRPAPIQVTWLGYPNTTGMRQIDYRLTDSATDPAGLADTLYSEELVRLDHSFLCYQGNDAIAASAPSPCSGNNHITFGSFNNLLKVTGEVVDLWAQIIKNVPDAKLILKTKQLADKSIREAYRQRFAAAGVHPEQVELLAIIPEVADHLRSYNRIDIALDPLFYNGTTTTFEALWMGVPVITLAGDRHASRVGASILTAIGRGDLVAHSASEYVDLACALATDTDRLVGLRGSLRRDLKNSPLCDAAAFASKIEAAYAAMWEKWCHST